ncbi:hypothetical protein JOC34_003555 [Virgibacillus halotolerans]|uniref:hypothetical protein n=1 Tax=Virgibacillus halotolerans TaxID=1071053 RepID=UPI0019604C37|nr:hypothetical protein [Virgibacillus halotolerans]MBM7601134.1 hypothetical protein [Virgibacillus halotolerans]
MEDRTIYFLFTDTGTYLSKAINYCTRQTLNHVSISFDSELSEVYSFGRKQPRNPFIGGFVKEDIRSDFLKNSNCAIYSYTFTEQECTSILNNIKEIEADQSNYKYNFIGLIGVLLQIEINRKHAYFCSQFVAMMLRDSEHFNISKPACFTTPTDIRMHEGMQLIYEGKLKDYQVHRVSHERKLVKGNQTVPKQSFIFLISSKVKRFVIK